MEFSIDKIHQEIMEIHGYDAYGAWCYVAHMFGLNLGVTGKAQVMEQMKFIRTNKAILDAKESKEN
jgi:hypothetical protein